MKISRPLFLFLAIATFGIQSNAQQKFIAYATGPQAGTSSTRHLIIEVTVQPPTVPGNAANLVFQGRGGSSFPAEADTAICAVGSIACRHVPFSPDSSWIISFDITADALTSLRQNR